MLYECLPVVLRDSFPTPLSTDEVADRCPPAFIYGAPYSRRGFQIYRHLRALEKRGIVARCPRENDRRVFWTYLPDADVDGEIEALDAIWEASC